MLEIGISGLAAGECEPLQPRKPLEPNRQSAGAAPHRGSPLSRRLCEGHAGGGFERHGDALAGATWLGRARSYFSYWYACVWVRFSGMAFKVILPG